jgi:hypothetical protein
MSVNDGRWLAVARIQASAWRCIRLETDVKTKTIALILSTLMAGAASAQTPVAPTPQPVAPAVVGNPAPAAAPAEPKAAAKKKKAAGKKKAVKKSKKAAGKHAAAGHGKLHAKKAGHKLH